MIKFGVGQPVTRAEDQRLLTGTGRYADDVNLDDTSWNNDELLPDPDRPAVYSL